jgi:hypothetical protein
VLYAFVRHALVQLGCGTKKAAKKKAAKKKI